MARSSRDPNEALENKLPAWYTAVNETRGAFPMYEHLARQGFPTVQQLRQGILLGCIADALSQATGEGGYAEHGWDQDTYWDDNQQGETWAVAFTPKGAVAVFYTNESERNPFPPGRPPYDQSVYFRGMPATLQTAKERALSWMITLEWKTGGPNAVVTAAMWADGERFTADEPWEGVFRHSAWACHKQLLPLDVALIEWRNEFDLDDQDVHVLRSLYLRRTGSNEAVIRVEPWEREALTRHGNPEGLESAQGALAVVGIELTSTE